MTHSSLCDVFKYVWFHCTWFFCIRVQRSSTSVPHSLATWTQAWAYCPVVALLRFSLSPAKQKQRQHPASAADGARCQPSVAHTVCIRCETSRHNQSQTKSKAQQCKWLEATACVVFFRAPFGSETLENVSSEEMHQAEREATATSRLRARFKWKQCLDLKLFLHLLRQVKQS